MGSRGIVVTPERKNKEKITNGKRYRTVAWGSETAKSGNCPNMQAKCRRDRARRPMSYVRETEMP